MLMLCVLAAFVVDFGMAYVNKNQAQAAADAGALAAGKVSRRQGDLQHDDGRRCGRRPGGDASGRAVRGRGRSHGEHAELETWHAHRHLRGRCDQGHLRRAGRLASDLALSPVPAIDMTVARQAAVKSGLPRRSRWAACVRG